MAQTDEFLAPGGRAIDNTIDNTDSLYRIYGLRVRSPWQLPAEAAAADPMHDAACDVEVSKGVVPFRPTALRDDGTALRVSGEAACYEHRSLGAFCVRAGRELIVEPGPDAHPEMIRVGILGPALGLALLQRGELVLHGSAVAVEGRAVAFLGASGRGKSTMAATMVHRGHTLLTDDLLVLRDPASTPSVLPGYPRVKLWPDAARELGRDPEEMQRLYPGIDKRVLDCADSFADQTMPLRRIYVLRGGPSLAIGDLAGGESFMSLSMAWFGARFGEASSALFERRAHLESLGGVVRAVPVKYLQRPRQLSELAATASSIEADLSASQN